MWKGHRSGSKKQQDYNDQKKKFELQLQFNMEEHNTLNEFTQLWLSISKA